MKKNKLALLLISTLIILCTALFATACNDKKYTAKFIFINAVESDGNNLEIIFREKAGEKITPPTASEIAGKRFKGWFLDENGIAKVDELPTVMPEKNVTYYGIYETLSTYTVNFVIVGESGVTIPSLTDTDGATLTPPTTPEIGGKKFVGWFETEACEGEPIALPSVITENKTYYGKYEIDDNPQIPSDYNLKFNEKEGNRSIYMKGETVYLDLGNSVLVSTLSKDGNTAEYTINSKDYCAFLNYTDSTFGLYAYAYPKGEYLLYLPINDSFNSMRCLRMSNGEFQLMGYNPFDDSPTPEKWASGTYVAIGATDEYQLTVTEDFTAGTFTDCRIKLTKRARQNVETGDKPLAYDAFMIYDENLTGSFAHYQNAKIKLVLDGYGFATYTDENGVRRQGVCETAEVDVFQDRFINFTDKTTGKTELLLLVEGQTSNMFAPIGSEIGLYRVFDVTEQTAGSFYLLINGWGEAEVWYGADVAYNPQYALAVGTYEVLASGEIEYTFKEIADEDKANLLTNIYKTTFRFKLTTYGSGLYITKAYAVYDESLAGTYADESGTSTLVLDGYGNATHKKDGTDFSGVIQVSDDLLLITAADDSQRIFRIKKSDSTFRQIGNEYGYYISYSYLNGLNTKLSVYFDGEGKAVLYDITDAEHPVELKTGTYAKRDGENEYDLIFASGNMRIALRQMNFGTLQNPAWYSVYLEYVQEWDRTFKNAAQNETLVLDGYGLKATYTDALGNETSGEFVWEWSLVTLAAIGETDYSVLTFKIDGNTFTLKTENAGVYNYFVKDAEVTTSDKRILLDGDGNARYSVYNYETETYENKDGSVVYSATDKSYTFTSSDGTLTIKFAIFERNFVPTFSDYEENWEGEYVNEFNEAHVFKMDGYGNAWYRDEECSSLQVFGENGGIVSFNVSGEKFTLILNKAKHTFERTMDAIGYFYLFDFDTVNGRKRLCILPDDSAYLQEYSDTESVYKTVASGTLTKGIGENVFIFTPAQGNGFTFKTDEVGGYPVYRVQDEHATTLTCASSSAVDYEINCKIILNGFGDAQYTCYDTKEKRERTYEGYYTIDGNTLTFVAVGTNGAIYWTYTMTVDFENNTFDIIRKV